MTRNPPAPVPLPRKRSLRHQFPTRHAPRPRRLERRGDMPPALDPTQYHPAIDNVSAGALHRKVRSSSSRRSLVVTIVPPSVTRPSRGVRPSLPTSTPRPFRSPNPQFLAGIRRLQAERRLERTRRPLRLRLRRRRRGGREAVRHDPPPRVEQGSPRGRLQDLLRPRRLRRLRRPRAAPRRHRHRRRARVRTPRDRPHHELRA